MALVPIPLDVLVGAYYPWAENFWGFVAGVPYKNTAISDAFSLLLPHRILVMEAFRNFQWPLWNPYSFSGYPLLANWQSAPFNPLNILMLIFGDVIGFGLIVAVQPILAFTGMFLFLRNIKVTKSGSFIGAVSFALGGFMMTNLTSATTSFIFGLTPLGLFIVNKFLETSKSRYLIGLSLLTFCILTGGFFQPAFYALLLIGSYAILESLKKKERQKLMKISAWILLGAALAAIQLVPVIELLGLSIRSVDQNILEYSFGLLPLKNIFTFMAPDFFGNPTKGNFFGFLQYQEVSGYLGVVALMLAIAGLTIRKKDYRQKFFAGIFLIALGLAFENPASKLIYDIKLPLLSTGYASRWLIPASFAGSALAAFGYDHASRKTKIKFAFGVLMILGFAYFWINGGGFTATEIQVAKRNLILPFIISLSGLLIFTLPKKIAGVLICLVVLFDMGRYTVKFTPLVNSEYGTRKIEFLTRLKNRAGIYRVISEPGIMPANTWIYPRVYSVGGYDPLLYKDYEVWFRALDIGNNPNLPIDGNLGNGWMTRYLNVNNTDSPLLDLAGVKYLLTLKLDRYGKERKEGEITEKLLVKYTPVEKEGVTALLENKSVMPRAMLYYQAQSELNDTKALERLAAGLDFRSKLLLKTDTITNFESDPEDSVAVTKYSSNDVEIKAITKYGAYLFLSDTYFPGWHVSINGKESEIIRADGIFRAVKLSPGESEVKFWYYPESFKTGLAITEGAGVIILGLGLFAIKSKKI